MANIDRLLKEYSTIIRLSDDKRRELILVRDNLRSRLKTGYAKVTEQLNVHFEIESQSQGSFVMDTIIRPERDDYDIDDGLYFVGSLQRNSRPDTSEFHEWVVKALDRGYDDVEKIIDKSTCVRVRYKDGFHVDIPIYYAADLSAPDLADKNKGWILSHPIEFIAWFEAKINSGFQKGFLLEERLFPEFEKWTSDIRKADHQLRRIVRYLKSWADLRREEMPCGIIMTILAANHYSAHERDDIALKETLVNIHSELNKRFRCLRPTTPEGEDLLKDYANKESFLKYLGYFIDNAKKALEEPNERKSADHWQKSLGKRFPCNLAKDIISASVVTASLAAGVTSKPWG
jgi:hypothetical protein